MQQQQQYAAHANAQIPQCIAFFIFSLSLSVSLSRTVSQNRIDTLEHAAQFDLTCGSAAERMN